MGLGDLAKDLLETAHRLRGLLGLLHDRTRTRFVPVTRAAELPDEAMTIRVSYHASERTDDILFGIAIHDENGNHLFGTNTRILGLDVPPADGDGEMSFEFHRVPLLDGTYLVTLAIQSTDEGTVYDWREQQARFEVMNPSRTNGLVSFPIDVHFGDTRMNLAEGTGA